MLHRRDHRGSRARRGAGPARQDLLVHAEAHEAGGDRDFLHAGTGVHHPLLGARCRARPGVHADRMAVPLLRHVSGLARRRTHRQRYLVQRAVRQPAADHRATARARPDPPVRRQLGRRRDGQDGGCAIDHCGDIGDEPGGQRRDDLPVRVLAFDRAGGDRRTDRTAVRVRLPGRRAAWVDDREVMDPRVLDRFRAIVGGDGLLTEPEQLRTYECDGLTNFRVVPSAVVLPTSTEQVQAIVRVCYEARIPFVARGSGTGLSGGALPIADGIVISLARRNRILAVDIPNARVAVEPGLLNLSVTQAVAPNYFYAPDPSSQQVCSIGGNVAENAGGAHCLKYGFTTTHVLGLEVVLPDGSVVHLGGKTVYAPGYDLCGVFVGSEGTLGVATKVILRITKRPETVETLIAAFNSVDHTGAAVSEVIAARGRAPALQEMDKLAIQAAATAGDPGR